MSEWKEIWYAWDGLVDEPDLESVSAIMDRHGNIVSGPFEYISWLKPKGGWFNCVDAYTLGEKRRRCTVCDGAGWATISDQCNACSNTGWEYRE